MVEVVTRKCVQIVRYTDYTDEYTDAYQDLTSHKKLLSRIPHIQMKKRR